MEATIKCEHCPTRLTLEVADMQVLFEKACRQGWTFKDSSMGGVKCPACGGGVSKSGGPTGDDRLEGGRRSL